MSEHFSNSGYSKGAKTYKTTAGIEVIRDSKLLVKL